MDTLDDSENNAKISDSAYSNSCSNSQSRKSHSWKSTRSGSRSSGSSGYGGLPSTSGYGSNKKSHPSEKRHKPKERKKKKSQVKTTKIELAPAATKIQTKFDPPEPVKEFEVLQENREQIEVPMSPKSGSHAEKGVASMEICNSDKSIISKEETGSDNGQLVSMSIVPSSASAHFHDCFSCVISMHDGVVMYTTSAITTMLGYPKDMWIGRSFLDFIHEKDRNVFASQITSELTLPQNENGTLPAATTRVNTSSNVVCRLRRYRCLNSCFGVKDNTVSFMPFLLKLSFKNVNDMEGDCIYLVVQATPFYSAFKKPYEVITNAVPFVIRHAANGNMQFIDPESVSYLGYLPQDLMDKNALQMYHPHDLDYLQKVYETTVKEGSVPRCTEYRMLVQNGGYIKLETEWSSFVNPWSKKLEFVLGKHHVVQGPGNPNIFQAPDPKTLFRMSEDDTARTHCMRENIVRIMNNVLTKPAETAKKIMTKRCQDLAAFMESLIETPKSAEDRRGAQYGSNSYYDRDSVMLGGISPHHDYMDSKSSTDTPLSYNQLNYNDTLQRYFDSHQSYVYEDVNTNMPGDSIYGITDSMALISDSASPSPVPSGDSGNGEGMCHPNPKMSRRSASHRNQDYTIIRLNESLLKKHNVEMERDLVRKQRETRSCSRSEREREKVLNRQKKKAHIARCNAVFQPTSAGPNNEPAQPHGLKRTSKTTDPAPVPPKNQCTSPPEQRRSCETGVNTIQTSNVVTTIATTWQAPHYPENTSTFLLGLGVPQQIPLINPVNAVPGLVPMYYTPSVNTTVTTVHGPNSSQLSQCQHQTMPCMMYGQALPSSPIVYAPIDPQLAYNIQQNIIQTRQQCVKSPSSPLILARSNYEKVCRPGLPLISQLCTGRSWRDKRKNEIHAKLLRMSRSSGSTSSADLSNRTLKAKTNSSRRCRFLKRDVSSNEDRTDGESSYYSLYSSFFKTESGSADDSDNKRENGKDDTNCWKTMTQTDEFYGTKRRTESCPKRSTVPPWMEQVSVTSDLTYKYQVPERSLEEVLASDKKRMETMEQPPLVNEQLAQLYMDLQLQGVAAKLTLEEGITSSSSSDEETTPKKTKKNKSTCYQKKKNHSTISMIYEENALLPPPEDLEVSIVTTCS